MPRQLTGFIVLCDGEPCRMDLHDDIQGGNTFESPFPVFSAHDDAVDAANALSGSVVDPHEYHVSEVVITFGSVTVARRDQL